MIRLHIAVAFAALALAAPVGAAAPAPQTSTVRIENFTFVPAAVTVRPGASVTFVNGDDIPHAVMAVDKSFRSQVLDSGESFVLTLSRPGEYAYFCSLHPHMTGKIVVKAAG